MKLLADVNVSPRVVALLRDAGFEVERVGERLSPRSTDAAILAEAVRQQAVVVSEDQDFSAILAVTGASKPSHVNVRVSFVDAALLAARLIAVLHAAQEDLEVGAIVTIDDRGARVRRLPVT